MKSSTKQKALTNRWEVILNSTNKPIIIAGPCSAESQEQMVEVAKSLSAQGVTILRAGIWKPRT
ncbi:MAG: hypothetical protein JKY54_15065, partial [Flavobacteriales bacterium]|nr:hypothetical protein [Flavobacteriales bacterium]